MVFCPLLFGAFSFQNDVASRRSNNQMTSQPATQTNNDDFFPPGSNGQVNPVINTRVFSSICFCFDFQLQSKGHLSEIAKCVLGEAQCFVLEFAMASQGTQREVWAWVASSKTRHRSPMVTAGHRRYLPSETHSRLALVMGGFRI